MGIDILACQDYGGCSNDVDEALAIVRRNIEGLEKARKFVDKAGVRLWSNCELYNFETGPDGRHICVPGPFERIKEQIRMQAPLVEKLICYQYQGIMNRRTDLVNIGAPGTQNLYDDYKEYLESLKGR